VLPGQRRHGDAATRRNRSSVVTQSTLSCGVCAPAVVARDLGDQITEGERLAVLTSYGWESGLIGTFTDGRIESLANEAINATPTIANPAHRYPAALGNRSRDQIALVSI